MGQALLEQQEANEMAERVKDYQLKDLADQNETSKRIEDAKGKSPQPITQGPEPASSSGSRPGGSIPGLGSVVGGVARGMARGVGGVVGAMGSVADLMTGTTWEEDAEQHENEQISNRIEQQSKRSSKAESSRRAVQYNLDEVEGQKPHGGIVLPTKGSSAARSSTSSSYSSVPSSPAPTHHYIGSSPAQSPAPTIKSSPPVSIRSSPQVIRSSPETVRSSSSIEGPFGARSSSSQPRARTEGEIREERDRRKKFGY